MAKYSDIVRQPRQAGLSKRAVSVGNAYKINKKRVSCLKQAYYAFKRRLICVYESESFTV
jgi:hypothetical protein